METFQDPRYIFQTRRSPHDNHQVYIQYITSTLARESANSSQFPPCREKSKACAAWETSWFSSVHDESVLKTLSPHATGHWLHKFMHKTSATEEPIYARRRADGEIPALKPVVGQRCPEHALRRPHSAALDFVPELVARARVSRSSDAGNKLRNQSSRR